MFYSKYMFVQKGNLGNVWLAANWEKKLTKTHINKTSVTESVDSIMKPQAPLALRLSGQLLVGVVRIYNRKTKYLQEDASDALSRIKLSIKPKHKVDLPPDKLSAQNTLITLPDTNVQDLFQMNDMTLDQLAQTLNDDEPARHLNIARNPGEITMDDSTCFNPNFSFSSDLSGLGMGELQGLGNLPMEDFDSSVLEAGFVDDTDVDDPPDYDGGMSDMEGEQGLAAQNDSLLANKAQLDTTSNMSLNDQSLVQSNQIQSLADDDSMLHQDESTIVFRHDSLGTEAEIRALEKEDALRKMQERIAKKRQNKKRKRDRQTELTGDHIRERIKNTKDIVHEVRPATCLTKRPKYSHDRSKASIESLFNNPFVSGLAPELLRAYAAVVKIPHPKRFKADNQQSDIPDEKMSELPTEETTGRHSGYASSEPYADDPEDFPLQPDSFGVDEEGLPSGYEDQYAVTKWNALDTRHSTSVKDPKSMSRPLGGWSKRTRKMYEFLAKKKDKHLSYNDLTEGKQKMTAVGVFYELLVLKSRNLLHVKQGSSYGDIRVTKTKEFRRGADYKLSDHIDDI